MRAARLATVTAALLLLAACGGGEDDAGAGATTPPVTEPTAEETTPEGPPPTLCDLVSPADVAAALQIDATLENAGPSATSAQPPSSDLCRFDVTGTTTFSQVTLGVGILSITADDLAAARASQSYLEYTGAPELGEAGYVNAQIGRGVFLVDDRAVVVRAQLEPAATVDQLAALAQLVTPLVAEVPEAPAEITEPECGPYASVVEAVLGAPAEVRRDRSDETGLTCSFATKAAYTSVFVSTDPQYVTNFDAAFEGLPGVENVDAGQKAQYVDGQAAILIDDTTTATILVEPVPAAITPEITALMQTLGAPS